MKLKKLFHVLVLGGAAVGLPHCGPGPEADPNGSVSNGVNNGGTLPDGGTLPPSDGGGGGGGGGPHFW
jgi:hypothetical protein